MKKLISIILLCALIAVGSQFPIEEVAGAFQMQSIDKALQEKETPIIASDDKDLIPQELIDDNVVKVWNSKQEYENAMAKEIPLATEAIEEVKFVPVWYSFVIRNFNTKELLPGAIVIIDGTPRFADAVGEVYVKITNPNIELRVEKNNYSPYVEYVDIFANVTNEIKEKIIYLKNPSDDLPVYNAKMEFDGDTVNLLSQKYSVDMSFVDSEELTLDVQSKYGDKFFLYKENDIIATSTTGKFGGLNIRELKESDKPIYVQSEYEGLKSNRMLLLLEKAEFGEIDMAALFDLDSKVQIPSFNDNIIGQIEFDYADFLKEIFNVKPKGNNVCKINELGMGINIIHDNKEHCYKIAYGFDLGFGNVNKNKERNAIFNTFKRSYNCSRNNPNPKARSKSIFESLKGAFKKVNSKYGKFAFGSMDYNISVDFAGYIEVYDGFGNNGSSENALGSVKSCALTVGFEFVIDLTAQFVVVFVPVFVTFTPGVGLKFDYDSAEISRAMAIILTLKMKVAGGVGIYALCSASVYGNMDFIFNWEIGGNKQHVFTGKARFGINLTFLFFSVDVPIGPELEMYNVQKKSLNSLIDGENLNNQSNVFLDSRPKIVMIGDKKLAVWVDYDMYRDQYNNTKLYYAISQGDTWSVPKAVYDDGKADFYPELNKCGNEIFVTWHKSGREYTKDDTVETIAATSEVYVSKFDMNDNAFLAPQRISQSKKMATLPKLVQDNDNTSIVWQSNSLNDWFSTSGTNTIYSSRYENGSWKAPIELYNTDLPITSYDCKYEENEIQLALCLDADKDLGTLNDREIRIVSKSSTKTIDGADIAISNPQYGEAEGMSKLFYYKNNTIVMCNMDTSEEEVVLSGVVGLVDDYNIVSEGGDISIIYSKIENGVIGKYSALFNASTNLWHKDIKIFEGEGNIEDMDIIMNNGTLTGILLKTERDDDNKLTSSKLSVETHKFETDIVLQFAYMLDAVLHEDNIIYLDIKNEGATAISIINVNYGMKTQQIILENNLLPGEKTKIKINMNYSDLFGKQVELALSLPNMQESNLSNNKYNLNIDYANLEIGVIQQQIGGKESFIVAASNRGIANENIILIIRKNNKQGAVVYQSEMMVLGVGEKKTYNVCLDYRSIDLQKGDKLYFEIASEKLQLSSATGSYNINEDVKEYSEESLNKWHDVLQTAKRIIGGII